MDGRPPPPPHGNSSGAGAKASNLPPGNYDIFVIPPHSSGSGFLYLPSLQPHRNSFLAGVACTLTVVGIWAVIVPIIKQWLASVVASGGAGVLILIIGVGVVGWAYGKTQIEGENGAPRRPGAEGGAGSSTNAHGFTPGSSPFGSKPRASWQQTSSAPFSEWAKAREETKKKEEERRRKAEADKKASDTADKDKWEKAKARDREAKEKEIREKMKREADERASKVSSGARAAAKAAGMGSESKPYKKPTAQSYAGDDDEYSYRPYDQPKQPKAHASNSSFVSNSSNTPSHSTARTTPPPSHRGPYSTKDPEKIQIKAVYAFNDLFPKPTAQLISGSGHITDGLVLKMTTEGLFIDDDVRGVAQREWDVKAWTLKLVEVWCSQFSAKCGPSPARYALKQKEPGQRFWNNASGKNLEAEELDAVLVDMLRTCKGSCPLGQRSNQSSSQSGDCKGLHLLRANTRDANNKRYIFVIDATEAWKVAVGLQTLRRGSQVRSLAVSGLSVAESNRVLASLGWT